MVAQNESIEILKETKKLDQISKSSSEPICITKNGKESLYILNPTVFKQLLDELKHEKEINLLLSKLNQLTFLPGDDYEQSWITDALPGFYAFWLFFLFKK
jgi:PHD/YefM family antitoxin component YafN of YafNO toxin-antitoxin module